MLGNEHGREKWAYVWLIVLHEEIKGLFSTSFYDTLSKIVFIIWSSALMLDEMLQRAIRSLSPALHHVHFYTILGV